MTVDEHLETAFIAVFLLQNEAVPVDADGPWEPSHVKTLMVAQESIMAARAQIRNEESDHG